MDGLKRLIDGEDFVGVGLRIVFDRLAVLSLGGADSSVGFATVPDHGDLLEAVAAFEEGVDMCDRYHVLVSLRCRGVSVTEVALSERGPGLWHELVLCGELACLAWDVTMSGLVLADGESEL